MELFLFSVFEEFGISHEPNFRPYYCPGICTVLVEISVDTQIN
jgi:hypothetical protein